MADQDVTARFRRTPLVSGLCGAVLMLWLTSGAAQPKPPTMCMNGSCTKAAPAPSTGSAGTIKWNPGHYMLHYATHSPKDKQAVRFEFYDEISDNEDLEGVSFFVAWKELEQQRGDYAAGIAYLREELDYLKSLRVPKRLWVRLTPHSYRGNLARTCSHAGTWYPNYIIDMDGCGTSNTSTLAALWKPAVTDAYIDLIEALAAAFDDEPYFEGISLVRETATGGAVKHRDFSWDAYERELGRLSLAAKRAFKKTNVAMSINFMEDQTRTNRITAYMRSIGVGVGGPDVAPTCIKNDCSKGYADPQGIWGYNAVYGNGAGGGSKVAGVVPLVYSVESSELGYDTVGQDGGYTARELVDFANGYLKATHVLWMRNIAIGTSEQRWHSGILPVIAAQPLVNTKCPSTYSSGCRSD